MSKKLPFKWLALGAASAMLLGACVVQDEEDGVGSEVVVDDGMDPAAGDIAVELSVDKASVSQTESVTVTVKLTNTTKRSIHLPAWYAPGEELEEDLFLVMRGGQPVEFTGPHYKRPAMSDEDYVVLGPGKSVTRTATLSGFYDLTQSATYTIRYAADMLTSVTKQAVSLDSNEVSLWIEGRANAPSPQFISAPGPQNFGSVGFSKCSADQQTTVTQALGAASTMADGAVLYLGGTPAANPRYTTWFGAFSTNGWNTAKSQFVAIKDAVDSKPLNFDCGCKKKYYAYVYPNQPYNVYLCSVFWSAPLSGTDSKGGTIIHELSHFDAVAGTDDWVYGQSGAKSLAISDPAKALNNADSHEYFAENTPALQ
ncbi:peptidase M35 [Polyangium jinanense]|uniref:M35 family metallo-endopeptidase n=1 Tax=Polyangium jinanense TaxID=2829994 RepID=UPI0023413B7E|nr:M35 family metallo-endopeptidase [Polyangium jinanense]MDC3960610.1 peptidase M35 [Polyangium jinanense]